MRTKEQKKAYMKVWRRANPEKVKAINVKYRQTHKEQTRIYNAKYYPTHYEQYKEQDKARASKWAKTHKENVRIIQARFRRAHPEKGIIDRRRRRALIHGVLHEDYMDSYIFLRDNWVCGICGRKINKRLKYPNPLSASIDHIIPLSKGGNDNPVNVQASHLRCNVGKNAINKSQLRLFG